MAERREQLGLTWNEVAERAGMTKQGLRTVRQETRKIMPLTKRGIEEALRWQPGSIDVVLNGGDPQDQVVPDDPGHVPPAPDEAATIRRVPAWFATEVERRGLRLADLTVDHLRVLARHFGYSLAELMLNAGLASERDLEIEERPALSPASEALMDFDAAMKRVAESPFLSRRQRKEAEEFAERTRGEAVKKIRGSKPSRPSDDTP